MKSNVIDDEIIKPLQIVTSVSGGKTSCYMALNYPSDHYIFAVVLTSDESLAPKSEKLLKECRKRIPGFIASLEDDRTLENVLFLEKELGREIKWVCADYPLEDFMMGTTDVPGYRTGAKLPNSSSRFCTINEKITPIIHHCYSYIDDLVIMNIGFRADEKKRVINWKCSNDKTKIAVSCNLWGSKRWNYTKQKEWRITRFPLYEDGVTEDQIKEFWRKQYPHLEWPKVSNCRNCMLHTDDELALINQECPQAIEWVRRYEKLTGHTFGRKPIDERLASSGKPGRRRSEKPCHCTD